MVDHSGNFPLLLHGKEHQQSQCGPWPIFSTKISCEFPVAQTLLGLIAVFTLLTYVPSTYAVPVTLSGQKLILHTAEYRERYHQNLLREKHTQLEATDHSNHRHHLHLRSAEIIMPPPPVPSLATPSSSKPGQPHCERMTAAAPKSVDALSCKNIKVVDKLYERANLSFNTMRSYLNEFVKKQFDKDAEKMLLEYSLRNFELEHPHKGRLLKNVDEEPHVTFAYANVTEDLRDVYRTLRYLSLHAESITRSLDAVDLPTSNEMQYRKYYHPEKFAFSKDFLDSIRFQLEGDVKETHKALEKLHIKIPNAERKAGQGIRRDTINEFLFAREYLCVLQYLRQYYKALIGCCQEHRPSNNSPLEK